MGKRSLFSEILGNKNEKPLVVLPKKALPLEAIFEAVVENAFKGGLFSLLFDAVARFLCSAVAPLHLESLLLRFTLNCCLVFV
ncbi:hypothetical protein CTI12_AA120000 [Artemisia annua]|uniref:Uncharacterized protein n=1 Tax=Artemisia annua TaxID=35608 RepID=A0A2U1PRT3_ARTAN|nr:hypothetical protein CTI12_AA120000 [Artemisia annua]